MPRRAFGKKRPGREGERPESLLLQQSKKCLKGADPFPSAAHTYVVKEFSSLQRSRENEQQSCGTCSPACRPWRFPGCSSSSTADIPGPAAQRKQDLQGAPESQRRLLLGPTMLSTSVSPPQCHLRASPQQWRNRSLLPPTRTPLLAGEKAGWGFLLPVLDSEIGKS